jgi:hypothetical protein
MADHRISQMRKVQQEALELFMKKNRDYGDSFARYGPVGVLVRLGDKVNRLSSVTKRGVTLVSTESMRDTLIDMQNYAAMAIMLLDETPDGKLANPMVNAIKHATPHRPITNALRGASPRKHNQSPWH